MNKGIERTVARMTDVGDPGPRSGANPEAAVRDLLCATDLWGAIPAPVVRISAALHISVVETAFTELGLVGLIVVDARERTIYVRRHDALVRQRLVVAHALGHYWMHMRGGEVRGFKDFAAQLAWDVPNNPGPLEREANHFAAALLLPVAPLPM